MIMLQGSKHVCASSNEAKLDSGTRCWPRNSVSNNSESAKAVPSLWNVWNWGVLMFFLTILIAVIPWRTWCYDGIVLWMRGCGSQGHSWQGILPRKWRYLEILCLLRHPGRNGKAYDAPVPWWWNRLQARGCCLGEKSSGKHPFQRLYTTTLLRSFFFFLKRYRWHPPGSLKGFRAILFLQTVYFRNYSSHEQANRHRHACLAEKKNSRKDRKAPTVIMASSCFLTRVHVEWLHKGNHHSWGRLNLSLLPCALSKKFSWVGEVHLQR